MLIYKVMINSLIKYFLLHKNFAICGLSFFVCLPIVCSRNKGAGIARNVLLCTGFLIGSVFSVLLFATFEAYVSSGVVKFGAVSTYGIYLFFVPMLWVSCAFFKKDVSKILDLYLYCAAITFIALRLLCIIDGCCIGKEIGSSGVRWPTREAEIIFFSYMLLVPSKRKTANRFVGLALNYSVLRFVIEFFRVGSGFGPFHIAHLWSLLTFAIYYGVNRKWQRKKQIRL